jgi:predicted short-subunit dehydrogenase-like oxidoreductase (DUF2520 family)
LTRINIAFKKQIIGSETKHIVLIGAGNVATHISRHLHAQGHRIGSVWSRTLDSAQVLASEVGAEACARVSEVPRKADFYILAVPDGAVEKMAEEFSGCQGIWLHTAGALSMEVFKGLFPEYGVIYPIQSLSKAQPIRPGHIPFLVEGSSMEVLEGVHKLASSISKNVETADSASRLFVHLAAVFANNFSNHMVHIAHEILKEQNLDVSMLDPLLEETFHKILSLGPKEAQTGPAVRDDQLTMKQHIELLKNQPEWEKLYTFISREIVRSREE